MAGNKKITDEQLISIKSSGKSRCGFTKHAEEVLDNLNNLPNNPLNWKSSENTEGLRTLSPGEEWTIITIPVVFHVVYNTASQNITEAKLQAQISQLNLDFSATNPESANTPQMFKPVGNMRIQFALAQRDPNGNPTNGIERRQTNVTSFTSFYQIRSYANGGLDPWDVTKYYNVWIGNVTGYLGVGGWCSTCLNEGVEIDYTSVGSRLSPGLGGSSYGLGKTLTHETAHWLNIQHIWGNPPCGDDGVDDTPQHNDSNSGCPTFPHYSTCSGTPVEMTMNFMDYTSDSCSYMFSPGQVDRARNFIESMTVGGGSPLYLFPYLPRRIEIINSLSLTAVLTGVTPTPTPSPVLDSCGNNVTRTPPRPGTSFQTLYSESQPGVGVSFSASGTGVIQTGKRDYDPVTGTFGPYYNPVDNFPVCSGGNRCYALGFTRCDIPNNIFKDINDTNYPSNKDYSINHGIPLGISGSAYSYSLWSSKTFESITILLYGIVSGQTITINASNGTTTLSSCRGCCHNISGNTLISEECGWDYYEYKAGARIKITSSAPFSGITVSGVNSNTEGFWRGVVVLSLADFVVLNPPSPTPTRTQTPTPTITPTNTVTPTPSVSPTITTSVTPTNTPTNSVTPTVTTSDGFVQPSPSSTTTPTPTRTPTPSIKKKGRR